MYIRRIARKNKDGSVVRYVQLAHNVWDPQARHAKAKVIHSLGREDKLDRRALRRLADTLIKIVGEGDQAMPGAPATQAQPLPESTRFLGTKVVGRTWLFDRLWHTLQVDQAFGSLAREIPFFSTIEQTLFALVCEYIHPDGISTPASSADDSGSGRFLEDVPLSQVTRTLSFLNSMGEQLRLEIVQRRAPDLHLSEGPLFAGTTQASAASLHPPTPSRLEAIGVSVNEGGLPVHCWPHSHDAPEVHRILSVDRDDPLELDRLSHPGRYRKVLPYIEAKEIAPRDPDQQERRILVRNLLLKEQRERARRRILSELEDQIAAAELLPSEQRALLLQSLKNDPVYAPYLAESGQTFRIRWSQALHEGRRDGKFVLTTCDRRLSTAALVRGYTGLLETVETLNALAHSTVIHRFTHRPQHYHEAHIFLCWMALFLIRYVEVRAEQRWSQIDRDLGAIQLGVFRNSEGTVYRRTEMTPEQNRLFTRLGVPEPPEYFDPHSREGSTPLLGAILNPWIEQTR